MLRLIFHYTYALLHHPHYRDRYAANLKRELPRIPFTDKRSGITNAPNRLDDEEYIVRLIKQVITVSLETVKIVKNLPDLGLPKD
jgi:predicted helicase